jgi:hypothetical protein
MNNFKTPFGLSLSKACIAKIPRFDRLTANGGRPSEASR